MSSPTPYITLLVLSSLLHLPGSSSSGTSVRADNLTAAAGADVTLKCQLLVQDTAVTQVNWNFCNDVHIAAHVNDYDTKGAVMGRFTERVFLAEDYGITIMNVSSSDQGFYCCDFNTFPLGKFTGKIHLEVLAAESSMRTLERYSWIILSCGILLLAAGGLAIFYYMRSSRWTPNTAKPNGSPMNPITMGTPSSVPAAQDGDDDSQWQEYFHVIPYGRVRVNCHEPE